MLINHVDAMDNFDINIMDSLPDPFCSLPDPFCGLPSISIMAYPPSSEPRQRLPSLPPEPEQRVLPPGPAIAFAQPASSVRVGVVLDEDTHKADKTYVWQAPEWIQFTNGLVVFL